MEPLAKEATGTRVHKQANTVANATYRLIFFITAINEADNYYLGSLPLHNHRNHIIFLAEKGERQEQAAEQACLAGRPTLLGNLFAFHFPALSRKAINLRSHLLSAPHRIREHQCLILLSHK